MESFERIAHPANGDYVKGMSEARFIHLKNRKLLRLGGEDVNPFLQGLVTCDLEPLDVGDVAFGGLLSPQGKILFDFFIIASPNGFLIDVDTSMADDLTKRLTFYRLRAKVTIEAMDERTQVFAIIGEPGGLAEVVADGIVASDPRLAAMGARAYLRQAPDGAVMGTMDDYEALRVEVGMPQGGSDFSFGDAFPHETLMDQFHGVDFAKGCYVGQEVVSRMQHRGTARKRIIKVSSDEVLPAKGCEILVGGKSCGEITSAMGNAGLAMIRLDRASAHATGSPALAGAQPVKLTIADWCNFDWPEAG